MAVARELAYGARYGGRGLNSQEASTVVSAAKPDPYRELFERSADAILIIEGETFVDCNQATVEMLRYANKEELLRTHPSELSPPTQPDGRESFEKANEMIAIAFEQGNHRFEWDHLRADGEVFPVEVLLTAVAESGRKILHVVWRDITERRALEEQLRQTHRLEAIGKLAGGIAHDFNNLLVAIIGNAELLELSLGADSRLMEHAVEIRTAGDRAASLVRQLLAFSRNQEFQSQVLDLNQITADMDRLLQRLIGEDVRLVTRQADEPIWIKAHLGQIEQVVMNLAANARDAMPKGGTVALEIRRETLSEDCCFANTTLAAGSYAMLAVSDTGIGMDHETVQRAFDPFFTTKEMGEGTGLGLATVHSIVRRYLGAAQLHSTPGRGTTVKVYLPLTTERGGIDERRSTRPPGAGGDETILVVEDEATVATLVTKVLRGRGYRIMLASDGCEGLNLYRANADSIDLLLTDVVMPKMGGPDLVRTLRAEGHRPKVLYASGYTNDALTHVLAVSDGVDLLEKPFSTAELIGRVRLALDRGDEAATE